MLGTQLIIRADSTASAQPDLPCLDSGKTREQQKTRRDRSGNDFKKLILILALALLSWYNYRMIKITCKCSGSSPALTIWCGHKCLATLMTARYFFYAINYISFGVDCQRFFFKPV